MTERLLIVNADDFGLTPGVCEAILRAHERGIVTSTSALPNAPAFDSHARLLASSGLGVGAHLCLVGEDPPLLTAREVPSLVDRDGKFALSWKQVMRRCALGRIDVDDLRKEFSAQFEALDSAGLSLTHVDSHQNLHLWPQIAGVMFELASARGINAVRVTRTTRFGPVALGVRTLSAAIQQSARHRGFVFPDASTGLDEAGHLDAKSMSLAIDALGQRCHRCAELATHPGTADDPDRHRYEWGYEWPNELEALESSQVLEAVARNGFRLGSFAELETR